jgi:hypothetical protein
LPTPTESFPLFEVGSKVLIADGVCRQALQQMLPILISAALLKKFPFRLLSKKFREVVSMLIFPPEIFPAARL